MTCACMFRGKISPKEVDVQLAAAVAKDSSRFVEWIPSSTKASICDVPPAGLKVSDSVIQWIESVGKGGRGGREGVRG